MISVAKLPVLRHALEVPQLVQAQVWRQEVMQQLQVLVFSTLTSGMKQA